MRSVEVDTPDGIVDTEKLSRAELLSVNVENDIIKAVIRVIPVEVEDFSALDFSLPIVRV